MRAFSLFEIVIVIALLGILLGLTLPISKNYIEESELDFAFTETVQNIRGAQLKAMNGIADSSWGIYINNTGITLYKGITYASRDIAYDQVYNFSHSIEILGLSEVNFSKIWGVPSTTGTITYILNNKIRSITLNQRGSIDY